MTMAPYIDPQDAARAQAAQDREQMDARLREERATQAASTDRARTALYGFGHSAHRAHLNSTVRTDLTMRGIVNEREILTACEKAWDEVAQPVLREDPAMPLELFKAVFSQEPGAPRLTEAEVEKRHETVLSMGSGTRGQVQTAMLEAHAALQNRPALQKAMETMGTAHSVAVNRLLVEQQMQVRGRTPGTARPWLRGKRA